MSRLTEIARANNLTSYIAGAFTTAAAAEINFLAPTVPVSELLVNVATYDSNAPFRVPDTRRAMHGDAVQLEFGGSNSDVALEVHAADAPIDLVYAGEGGQARSDGSLLIDLQSAGLMAATACATGRFQRVLAAASTAAGSATSITMNTSGLDVIDESDAAILDVVKACGGASNLVEVRLLWGTTALRLCRKHSSLKDRVSGGATKGASAANVTLESINAMTIIPTTSRVSTSVVENSKPGAASSRAFLLTNRLYVFAASAVPTRNDPSALKLLQKGNDPVNPSGFYLSADGRKEKVKFDWAEKVHAGNSGAIKALDFAAS